MGRHTYGYARVSSRDQNLDRQLDALEDFGVERARIYADKASGRDFDRSEYQRLLGVLGQGDLLAIKSIDRLGRNYDEVIDQWRLLTKELLVDVVVLDMPLLDTRVSDRGLTGTFISDMVLQLLSYVAQLERDEIRQRQAEGIAAARARGRRLGRPPLPRPEAYGQVKGLVLAKELTHAQAAKRLGVCRATFEKWLREDAAAEIPAKVPGPGDRLRE